ncbi:MAG: hypothetical protein ABSH15_15390, partial [Verrucomicrobiota bacterium]
CWWTPAFGLRPPASEQIQASVTYVVALSVTHVLATFPPHPSPRLGGEGEKWRWCQVAAHRKIKDRTKYLIHNATRFGLNSEHFIRK